jgi:hypothetical protein
MVLNSATIQQKVEHFESDADLSPNHEDLSAAGNNNPTDIREHSDNLLSDIETKKNTLIEEITSENNKGNIDNEEKEVLKEAVEKAADQATKNIKESSNVAIESIDDSSDTENLMYQILPFLIMPQLDIPLITLFCILLKKLSNKSIRYFLSVYFNIYKHMYYIFIIIILVLLSVFYILNTDLIYCDAPMVWEHYYQDKASIRIEALAILHNNIMYGLSKVLYLLQVEYTFILVILASFKI